MKQCLYVIQDNLSKMVMPPFSSPNDKVAKRDFITGAYHAEIPMQDLHLFKIGEFVSAFADENVTFQLKPIDPPELLDPTLSEISEVVSSIPTLGNMENPYADIEHSSDSEE